MQRMQQQLFFSTATIQGNNSNKRNKCKCDSKASVCCSCSTNTATTSTKHIIILFSFLPPYSDHREIHEEEADPEEEEEEEKMKIKLRVISKLLASEETSPASRALDQDPTVARVQGSGGGNAGLPAEDEDSGPLTACES